MSQFSVEFQPGNTQVQVPEGSTVMAAMDAAGIDFDFPCGGQGKCGKCRVKILAGAEQPTATELAKLPPQEIEAGVRLACITKVQSDLTVELVFKKLEHNILLEADSRTSELKPHVEKVFLEVDKASVENWRSDWHRLQDGLAKVGFTHCPDQPEVSILRQLPGTLQAAQNRLTAIIQGNTLLGIEPQDTTDINYGMAFDIGTTTIVGYLLNLNTGEEVAVASTLNPQTKFGADVISRVTFAGKDAEGLEKLHKAVTQAINQLVGEAAQKAGLDRSQIYAITIAANTCMHHLFLGINPHSVAVAPYVPVVSEPVMVKAEDLQITINPVGKVFVLPNIAGFVGADTTAVLLATELEKSEDIKLIIDIGTNGEIALGSKDQMVACSAAAGPAFEGAQISSGMRGALGAIDHVYFGEEFKYTVIGGGRPQGICGSALLDVVAGLIELGIIDSKGKILPIEKITNPAAQKLQDRLVQHEGGPAFLLADANITTHGRPILVTQRDIREMQLAKGAMAAGVRVLMDKCGVGVGQISEVLLAGAFGNYLNPHSACVIGLIPIELEGKIKMIGNAAGTGSRLALLSTNEYKRSADIAKGVEFVELGSYPNFNRIFAESTYFRPVG